MSDDNYQNHDHMRNIPRYALYRGKRVRILYYTPGETRPFRILDRFDQQRDAKREELTFLKEKKK